MTIHVNLDPNYRDRYFAGIGFSGVSASQKIVTIHHRVPSLYSWKLLMPRANGSPSGVRFESYVLKACNTAPNASVVR
jgi:hypothetical protein